ncbi:MAG: hypothetical protein JWM36_53 [Hyphomicrobiales bacterium]|nr:hypothetical protein [Hyphomicrobiales bacterium]
MNRSARDGQQLRSRSNGGRFLSASIIGLSALILVGGVGYVQYERGDAPFGGHGNDSQQTRAENPAPPRDLAQTEAARANAEKRLSDAMALQFTTLPQSSAPAPEKTAAAKPLSSDARVADLPPPALPSAGIALAAIPPSDPSQTVVARADTPAIHPLPMSVDEQGALMGRVEGLLRQGDIGAARAVLNRLVRENNPKAAFVLAQSYDPVILRQAKVIGIRPDADLARSLYAQALKGGISEAQPALAALQSAAP